MNKSLKRRLWALILVFAMLIPTIPFVGTYVSAANATGELSINDLSVTYEKLAGNASSCTLDGTTITATAQSNSGFSTTPGRTTVTITNTGNATATLSFSYTGNGVALLTIDGETSDTGSGSFSKALGPNDEVELILYSNKGGISSKKTATLTITDVALSVEKNVDVTFKTVDNGSYTVDDTAVTSDITKTKKSTEAFAVTATSADNYMFFGWYNETTGKYVSYKAEDNLTITDDAVIYPVFVSKTTALFGVGTNTFFDLTEACNFATTSTIKTVVLLNNGTVSGSHTIPAGITLLVPFDDANTLYRNEPACTSGFLNNAAWVKPTAYRTLTLAADANITVNGNISISGKHAASNGGKPYSGAPTGPVGWVKMISGSHITLNYGANLYAWGFIQGGGEITVNRGATVYENFQFTDFRGGTNLTAIVGDGLVFPINQYYVQNIEVPTKYEAGAIETLYTSAFSSSMVVGGSAPFIGDDGMFNVTDGYIVKDYIENKDRLQVDVYGNIDISSMTVEVSVKVDSSKYILPITNNISVNLHSGTTTVKQSVALLPGAEMIIGKDATLNILSNLGEKLNDNNSSGYHLVVYDRDEWFYGLDMETGEIVENTQYAFGSSIVGMYPLPNAPGRTYNRTAANDLNDAVLDVNGTIIADGNIYTTLGGAAIKSSEKTGTIVMQSGSGPDLLTFQAVNGTSYGIPMNSASLMNGDGSYLLTGPSLADDTIPATEPGTIFEYCAAHDKWYSGECEECNNAFIVTWNVGGVTSEYEVSLGIVPVYPNGTPAKDPDVSYHYVFKGWATTENGTVLESLPPADGNVTYYAVFDAISHNDNDKKAVEGKHYCDDCNYLMYSCINSNPTVDHLCDYGCGSIIGECIKGEVKCENIVDATCELNGSQDEVYYCTVCNKELERTNVKTDALGHKWNATEYNWSADGKSCQASRTCKNDEKHHESETVNAVASIKTPATCTENGWNTYTATFVADWAVTQYKDVQDIPATDHAWSVEYSWSADNKECAATHICANDANHNKTETVKVEVTVKTPATCTVDGWNTYTATFVADWAVTQSKDVQDIPATDHAWSVEYSWSADNKECTATHICANDAKHNETETVKVEVTVKTPATCTVDGWNTYTATFVADWANTQSKDIQDIPATDHAWGNVKYEFAPDGSSCTATRVCNNDKAHVETVNATINSSITTEADCQTNQVVAYTATFNVDWADEQTLDVVGEKNADVHTSEKLVYTDNNNRTHAVSHECCGSFIKNEEHKYVGNDHMCVCKNVESISVNVYWTENGVNVFKDAYFMPYGTNTEIKIYEAPEGYSFVGFATTEDGEVVIAVNNGVVTYNFTENLDLYPVFEVNYYTVKIEGLMSAEIKVPYGGNLLDAIKNAEKAGVIYETGSYIEITDETIEFIGYGEDYIGEWLATGYTWIKNGMPYQLEAYVTMPARDVIVKQTYDNVGWEKIEDGYAYYEPFVGYKSTGWQYIEKDFDDVDGGAWYYFVEGKLHPVRVEGINRADYPNKSINGFTYAPEGTSDEFIDAKQAWFVFDENGRFVYTENGIIDHNGATRYVVNGMIPWHYGLANDNGDYKYFIGDEVNGGNVLATGDIYVTRPNGLQINGKDAIVKGAYTFDTDGKLCMYDGIVKVGNDLRYYYNYCYTAKNGLIKIENCKYIYVRSSTAKLVVNSEYYIAGGDLVSGYYRFDENGFMINPVTTQKNGIYLENGAYYYYADGVKAYAGLIRYTGTADDGTVYDNAYIYVCSNGQLATGKYWITKSNGLMDAKTYSFNEKGIMDVRNGIVAENNSLYYYVDGILAKGKGLIKIDGNYYYVRSSGEVVNNCDYWITNVNEYNVLKKTYAFDKNGVMQDVEMSDSNLSGVVDGFYYVDGQIKYGAGPIVWNGDIYYVRSNGMVATGKYWTTTQNEILPSGQYVFDENGKLIQD